MAYNGDRKVHFPVGKRRSGKTHLAEILVERSGLDRKLYYDFNGHDYNNGVIVEGLEQFKRYIRRVNKGPFSMVYRSSTPREDHEAVCEIVKAAGNMVFISDEIDTHFKNGEPGPMLGDLIRRGRHDDVELIGITQRPRQMGEIRSQADFIYVFAMHEVMDLQYLKSGFGEKLVNLVKQLKQYEYVKVPLPYDEDQLEICKESDEGTQTIKRPAEMDQQPDAGDPMGLHDVDSDSNLPDQ